MKDLQEIEKHYTRKENQLFPFLEQKGFSGPSKVMWGKHDEVRNLFREIKQLLENKKYKEIKKPAKELISQIKGMVFKEEKILFPVAMRKLNQQDWIKIKQGESEIGYAWVKPGNLWDASLVQNLKKTKAAPIPSVKTKDNSLIHLDEGDLKPEVINLILKTLPFDISYVDENDEVKYYSATDDRLFPRSPGVIGRKVQNCHPPKSLGIVNKIVESFKKKEKRSAEFWIKINDKFIYIRYFPVYDDSGHYRGVLEVSQEITGIQNLKGEKRLLDW